VPRQRTKRHRSLVGRAEGDREGDKLLLGAVQNELALGLGASNAGRATLSCLGDERAWWLLQRLDARFQRTVLRRPGAEPGDPYAGGSLIGYGYVATTVILTVYGQLVLKWQVDKSGAFPDALAGKAEFLAALLINPWVISVFVGAAVAAMSWMAALTQFALSRAYPFVALSFVFVLVLSGIIFDEAITAPKVVGVLFVVAGLAIGSQP
jgi:multidrug transporter EmrE-like cation transporter